MIRYLVYLSLIAIIATNVVLAIAYFSKAEARVYSTRFYRPNTYIATLKRDGNVYVMYIKEVGMYYIPSPPGSYRGYTQVLKIEHPITTQSVKPIKCRMYVYTGNPSTIRVYSGAVDETEYNMVYNNVKKYSVASIQCDKELELRDITKYAPNLDFAIVIEMVFPGNTPIKNLKLYYNVPQYILSQTLGDVTRQAIEGDISYRVNLDHIVDDTCLAYFRDTSITISNVLAPTEEHFLRLLLAYIIAGIVLVIDYRRDPDNYKWVIRLSQKLKRILGMLKS